MKAITDRRMDLSRHAANASRGGDASRACDAARAGAVIFAVLAFLAGCATSPPLQSASPRPGNQPATPAAGPSLPGNAQSVPASKPAVADSPPLEPQPRVAPRAAAPPAALPAGEGVPLPLPAPPAAAVQLPIPEPTFAPSLRPAAPSAQPIEAFVLPAPPAAGAERAATTVVGPASRATPVAQDRGGATRGASGSSAPPEPQGILAPPLPVETPPAVTPNGGEAPNAPASRPAAASAVAAQPSVPDARVARPAAPAAEPGQGASALPGQSALEYPPAAGSQPNVSSPLAAALPGQTAPSSAPASASITRHVYARPGDDVTIGLPGEGWIFLGGAAGGNEWKGGLSYQSKSSGAQGTTFVFRARSLGDWALLFQKQNPATGSSREESVEVTVVSDAEFARLMTAGSPSPGAGAPTELPGGGGEGVVQGGGSGDLARAELLERQGRLTEALDEFERNWTLGNPALTQRIAALAYRVKRYPDAKVYWAKNESVAGGDWADLAVDGLMKIAVATRNPYELRGMFDQVEAISKIAISTDLLDAGRFLYQNKDWTTALRYLGLFLKRYPQEPGADAACYLVGQIYQANTPLQNVQSAMDSYHRILSDYPTSDYYGLAQANIAYLNRYYFEIR